MNLKKDRLMKLAGLLTEQGMVGGGGSNNNPDPGHRAMMNVDMNRDEEPPEADEAGQSLELEQNLNEDSTLDYLAQGKSHRVDIYDARDELAALAYEVAGELQGMHLDNTDRKTEKMIQGRLENIYKHLTQLKNLTN